MAAVRRCAALAERGVTASAGVAAWKAGARLPTGISRHADEALYAAKAGGGDAVVVPD